MTHNAAAEYDELLLAKARDLCDLGTVMEMRNWLSVSESLVERDLAADGSIQAVYAAILGRTQAVTAELVRWLDRIPEAHRG